MVFPKNLQEFERFAVQWQKQALVWAHHCRPLLAGARIKALTGVVVAVLLIALGAMTTNMLGKRILEQVEQTLLKIPFVATIYAGVKQVIDSFKSFNNMANFKRVVYIDYPADGCRLIGLVTGQFYDIGL